MISLNYSFFVEILIFLMMVVFLQRFLFRPLLKLWEEQEQLTVGKRKKAEELSRQIDQMAIYYEAQIWAARKLAQEERDKIRREALKEQEEMIQSARTQANEMIMELREKIALEYREALKRVQGEAEVLGKRIAEQILGKGVQG